MGFIGIRVSDELEMRLRVVAKSRGKALSDIVRESLEITLNNQVAKEDVLASKLDTLISGEEVTSRKLDEICTIVRQLSYSDNRSANSTVVSPGTEINTNSTEVESDFNFTSSNDNDDDYSDDWGSSSGYRSAPLEIF